MQRVSRLRFIILATIACAILFCIAAFSVSMAEWTLGADNNATKKLNGNSANFYVEYPRYVTSGGTVTEIPTLANDKYYLQVPKHGNTDMSDYYEMWENEGASGNPEKMITNVPLYAGGTFNVFKGTTKLGIANDSGGSTPKVTFDKKSTDSEPTPGTYTVNADGYYNFYFDYSYDPWNKMHVGYAGELSSDSVGGGSTEENGDAIDTTGYTYLFSVKYSDDDQVKQLWFKTGTGASGLYADLDNFAVHIRKRDPGETGYYYNHRTYLGSGDVGDGNMRYVRSSKVSNALEGQTLNVGTKDETVIVFGFEEAHYSNAKTHSGVRDLSDFTEGAINLISLHTAPNVAPKLQKSGGSSGGGGGGADVTPAEVYCEGLTDFDSAQIVESGEKDVRDLNAIVKKEDNKYVYKNYICVSRKSSETSTDDNSIAYLEFKVSNYNVDPYNIVIDKLTLNRRATDANGNIKNRFINPAPRIYNYDPTVETRLGPAATHTAPDPDGSENRLPIFAHGNMHDVSEGMEGETQYANMQDHYDDGAYVVLYFGDSDQQYFALDIEIEFSLVDVQEPADGVSFKLTVTANNKNSWERYESGFGEPWGFYMGGLINSVKTWDPNRTTKLERATTENVTSYDEGKEKEAFGNKSIEDVSITDNEIAAFNEDGNFNYKIINYGVTGGVRSYARYPKGKVDVSLTVNLTEGSLIKIYMLDNIGHRLDIKDSNGNVTQKNRTIYVMANEIVYDADTKLLFRDETYDIYDEDLNIIIPKTGTYMFRLVGYFHTGDEGVENSKGEMLNGRYFKYSDGKRYDYEEADDEGTLLPQFNLIVDTLFITCASDGNSTCTLTLDPNGGEFEGGITDPIQRTVTFGSDVNRLPKPTKEGATLLGWYYKVGDEQIDFEFGNPVTSDMTLYAKWAQAFTVTFDANDGNLPEGASNTAQTDNAGHLTQAQINAVKPTRTGYKFLGWFTTDAATGGTRISVDYTFKASITVYARWEAATLFTVEFDLNGLPIDAIDDARVYDGDTVTKPTITMPANYTFVNWNSKADGTGTAFDFTKGVTKNVKLYAKYYAAKGVYVNGVKTSAQFVEHVTNQEDKVVGFEVTQATDVITLWYNQARCAVKSSNDFADFGTTEIKLAKGVYTFYYKYAGDGEWGLWIALDKYIVTFDANTGKWADEDTIKHSQTGAINSSSGNATLSSSAVPADPSLANYRFLGWYDAASGGNKVTTPAKAYSASTTLYAQWIRQYTVTFHATDGSSWSNGDIERRVKVDVNSDASKPSPPTHPQASYTVDYWYMQDENTPYVFINNPITGDIDLYAHWAVSDYTVSFDLNDWPFPDVTIKDKTVAHGDPVANPNVTVPDHYTLVWYNSDTDTVYDFSSEVTGDLHLIAKWTIDNGVYANGAFVKELETNYETWGTTNLRVKAEDIRLRQNDKLTFWWNNKQITAHVEIREDCPSNDKITGTSYTDVTVATEGWYSLYYDAGNSGEVGVWVEYHGSYADSHFNAANDGVYNGNTKLAAFTQSVGKPYRLETAKVTLNATTTITVKYNNTNQTVASLSGGFGTLSGGKVTLEAGEYTFQYFYADNKLYISGKTTDGFKTGADDWYIVGSSDKLGGWSTVNPSYYVKANSTIEIELSAGDQFKIAKSDENGNVEWAESYGYDANYADANVQNAGGNAQIKPNCGGTYVVGFFDNKVYIVKADSRQEVKISNTTTVVVYGKSNSNLYMWNDSGNFAGGWPGTAVSTKSDYSNDSIPTTVKIIFNGSGQTADLQLTQSAAKNGAIISNGYFVFVYGGTIQTV